MQTLKQRRAISAYASAKLDSGTSTPTASIKLPTDYQTAKARMAPRPPLWWMLWMRIRAFLFERQEW